jgi:hypothetical protein
VTGTCSTCEGCGQVVDTARDRAIDAARDLARSLGTLMDRLAEASPEVRDRDLWAPAGRALSRFEVALEDLEETGR